MENILQQVNLLIDNGCRFLFPEEKGSYVEIHLPQYCSSDTEREVLTAANGLIPLFCSDVCMNDKRAVLHERWISGTLRNLDAYYSLRTYLEGQLGSKVN